MNIAEQLRALGSEHSASEEAILREAADEIDRLRSDVTDLLEASSEDTAKRDDTRLLVGWLLDVVLRSKRQAEDLDAEMAVHYAKRFLGVEEAA